MAWRLGIDLGTNSLGWAAISLEDEGGVLVPCGLNASGSRIFSDGRNPKDGQSNAAKRREPRGARKNRDRYLRRRARLMRQLIKYGLMPEDETERKALEGGKHIAQQDSDPWILRYRALHQEFSPYQLGRAIFHLHQRRGFKSNRKSDRADNEKGKVKEAIKRTKERLAEENVQTLGALFGKRRAEALQSNLKATKGNRKPQPLARVRRSGEGAKWQYDYYPTRELILDEFDLIWLKQQEYHSQTLSNEAREELRDTIEWQHPLKAQPVGKCSLLPEHERAPRALPSSQRARIFQEVNNLRVTPTGRSSYPLSREERDIIAGSLLSPSSKTAKKTFDQLRRLRGLSVYDSFNLETKKRKDLQGDLTAAKLMQDDMWGKAWFDLDLTTQDEIVDKLINEESEEKLLTWLCDTHNLGRDQAERVIDCPLPDGYGNLSVQALECILPHLEAEVIVYSDAVAKAGMNHSNFATGEVHDRELPYYGYVLERSVAFGTGNTNDIDEKRYGKIANPTVHVALNQIRAVVNDLIKRFGAPEQIVLELARDLPLSAKGKKELESAQKKNQDANERRVKELEEVYNQPNNYANRMRLRIYKELEALGKCCVFTGEQIGVNNLFSPEVEVEHILPFSRTFDDSFSNKTLSMRQANRDKGNQTPHEAFGHSPDGYDWEEISKRAAQLSPSKKWRFDPDAMDRFEKFEGGFLARQLTDTQYISRLAKAYLESIYGGQGYKGAENRVWVINGRLTADLRHYWGLNSVLLGDNLPEAEAQKKNRNDHRHHAIDAIVVACTDRSMLQKASREAQKNERENSDRLLAGTPEPWEGFRTQVESVVRDIVVSHKPDHGFQAAMLEDSAMSKIKEDTNVKNNVPLMRKYVDLTSIESNLLDPGNKKTWTVVDPNIRLHLAEITAGLTGSEFKQKLTEWANSQYHPIRRLRVYKRESAIGISERSEQRPYKFYASGSNYCYDIWLDEKGKWTGEVISTYEAYQLSQKDPDWWKTRTGKHGQKLLMRLRKGDYLQLVHDERQMIVQVYKFTDGRIYLANHVDANVDARIRDKLEALKEIVKAPSSLQKSLAKRVTVSPSGVVKIYE